MAEAVRVRGLRELNAAFSHMRGQLKRDLQKELRAVAEPVAEAIRGRASEHGFSAATIGGIRAGSRLGSAYVGQRRRKTTGSRPDFGPTQMVWAFIPGLEENEGEIVVGVEHMLDRLTAEHGF